MVRQILTRTTPTCDRNWNFRVGKKIAWKMTFKMRLNLPSNTADDFYKFSEQTTRVRIPAWQKHMRLLFWQSSRMLGSFLLSLSLSLAPSGTCEVKKDLSSSWFYGKLYKATKLTFSCLFYIWQMEPDTSRLLWVLQLQQKGRQVPHIIIKTLGHLISNPALNTAKPLLYKIK